jgi:hypothetical protein
VGTHQIYVWVGWVTKRWQENLMTLSYWRPHGKRLLKLYGLTNCQTVSLPRKARFRLTRIAWSGSGVGIMMENGNKLEAQIRPMGSDLGTSKKRDPSHPATRRVMQRRRLTIRPKLGHLGTKLPSATSDRRPIVAPRQSFSIFKYRNPSCKKELFLPNRHGRVLQ